MGASAACVDYGWHAAAVVGVAAAVAAGGDSSDSGADCVAVVAEAIVVAAAVAAIGALRVSDFHYGLGTVAFAAGTPGWERKTSATLAKGAAAAAAAVAEAGNCRLSRLACLGASTSVVSAERDVVASDSRECYRRAFPVADDHRASVAVDLVVAVELAVEHPCCLDDVQLPGGDAAAAAAALVADCAVAEAADVHQ